ncbi:LrgB family protein [Alkalihalophilus marmarensis]|uniref:LrgB family protein n=1 Tax=Alkalihalophilus marmarensis TaxID=521377 RepID=UPI002DBED628|nr:LrgB family protein [Alkalihalophilus marmarensis]MEC2071800.1 LrgB family protein [Alkalihalophilus marmarensis]
MNEWCITIIMLALTIIIYGFAKTFYKRLSHPFTLPILTSTLSIILLLLLLDIDYHLYKEGSRWLDELLGAAVVALAYPLYKQLPMLKRFILPILLSITAGAFIGVFSGVLLSRWLGIDSSIIGALAPKSITTPVAMEIAYNLGSAAPLAAVFVMIAGIGGAVLSPFLYKWFNITHPISRGIGMGCASHAIGTAKAFENGELDGAASSIAMTVSAIVVALIITVFF